MPKSVKTKTKTTTKQAKAAVKAAKPKPSKSKTKMTAEIAQAPKKISAEEAKAIRPATATKGELFAPARNVTLPNGVTISIPERRLPIPDFAAVPLSYCYPYYGHRERKIFEAIVEADMFDIQKVLTVLFIHCDEDLEQNMHRGLEQLVIPPPDQLGQFLPDEMVTELGLKDGDNWLPDRLQALYDRCVDFQKKGCMVGIVSGRTAHSCEGFYPPNTYIIIEYIGAAPFICEDQQGDTLVMATDAEIAETPTHPYRV